MDSRKCVSSTTKRNVNNCSDEGVGESSCKKVKTTMEPIEPEAKGDGDSSGEGPEDDDDPFNYSTIEIPTVVGLLKNVLTHYPDNGQILKELVQNAEDAGASTFEVVHDTRNRSTSKEALRRFVEGPALFIYNNAKFTDEDWHGIRMLSDSIKRDDLLKVGQFGLGFKSVFHFTDFVTIISGSNVLFMDPNEPESKMCRSLSLAKLCNIFPEREVLGMLGTYIGKDHLNNGHFPGTIFWFPLRKLESKLSATVYDQRKVENLFQSFSVEAPLCLTFLKSLESISVKRINESERIIDILKVELNGPMMPEARKRRTNFRETLEHCQGFPSEPLICKYEVMIDTHERGSVSQQHFKILHYLPCSSKVEKNQHIPLVGVAALMHPVRNDAQGQIFCFLPLPLETSNSTNLPIQVNGYFVLDQNRSHIKWKTEESCAESDVIWNESLVENILAEAYVLLLQDIRNEVTSCAVSPDSFYRILPSLTPSSSGHNSSGRWKNLSRKIWKELLKYPIIYSEVKSVMMEPQNVISISSLSSLPNEIAQSVRNVLEDVGLPLATIPECVETSLAESGAPPPMVTPKLLRNCLKNNELKSSWNRLHLLQYALSDCDYMDLVGIELLPLKSENWTTFSTNGDLVFQCTEEEAEAFVGAENQLLSTTLNSEITDHMNQFACQGTSVLRTFTASEHITHLLPISVSHIQRKCLSHKSLERWLQNVWSVLHRIGSLQNIENLPLIPIAENLLASKLLPLSSAIILKDGNCDISSEACVEGLRLLEINVLSTLPEYVRHPDLHDYLCKLDGNGVNQALTKVLNRHKNTDNIISTFNAMRTNDQRHSIGLLLDRMQSINPGVKDFLRKLLLFNGVDRHETSDTSVDNVDRIYPALTDFPVSSPEMLIFPSNENLRSLALKLGAFQISKEDLCCIALQSRYSQEDTKKLGFYILNNYELRKNVKIIKHLSQVKFVTSSSGKFYTASELYDPLDDDIGALIGEDLIPDCSYREYNTDLKSLGMKSVCDMPKKDLFKIVNDISSKPLSKENCASKIRSLFKVINSKSDYEEICKELLNVKCVYGESSRPRDYPSNLQWATDSRLYKPSDVKSFHLYKDVVGSLIPLVKCDDLTNISEVFGWNIEPTVKELITHLENVIDVCPVNREVPGSVWYEHLKKIYEYLNEQAKQNKDMSDLIHGKILLTKEHGFIEPMYFALDIESNCSPALFSVEREGLGMYEDMIKSLGISQEFSSKLVFEILQEKKQKFKLERLPENELILISNLLNLLFQVCKNGKDDISLLDLALPDFQGSLCPVKDLCIDDGTQLEQGQFRFLHEKVKYSQEMLRWLGIENKTKKHLLGLSQRMKFGQKEPLPTCLKNILGNYPCDSGIMKELLQNADDAGATEILFIKDMRYHPKEKLFDEKWAPLQGPALCVYNNRGFTKKDLNGIQNLGNSCKIQDPASTGQYGIGFNAVYHLTDAPSFLTKGKEIEENETLCMLDPLCMYDPQATNDYPGVQFKNLNYLRTVYPDSFKGYLEELDDLWKGDEGTMFRLPLRKFSDSKIGEVMRTWKLVELLDEFKSDMRICLLFLRNVRKISICTIENGELQVEYSVESHIAEEERKTLEQLEEIISERRRKSNERDVNFFFDMQKLAYELVVKDSNKETYRWFLTQQIGCSDNESLSDLVKGAFCDDLLKLMPQAGVALLLSSSKSVDPSFFRNFVFLPLPTQSGFLMCINGHFALDNARRNLWNGECDYKDKWNEWLMKEILAPVIAEAINSVREKMFMHDQKIAHEDYTKKIKDYYKILPVCMSAQAEKWKSLCKWIYQHVKKQKIPLFDVFIPDNYADNYETHGTNYGGSSQQFTVKPTNGRLEWHALHESDAYFPMYFSNFDVRNSMFGTVDKRVCSEEKLVNTLKRLGMKLGSSQIYQILKEAEIEIDLLKPESAITFLLSWNQNYSDRCQPALLSKVEETPFLSVDNVCILLKYISDFEDFQSKLHHIPLLVSNDNLIRTFDNEHPIYLTEYGKLLPEFNHEFMHIDLYWVMKDLDISVKNAKILQHFTLEAFSNKLTEVLGDAYKSPEDKLPLGGQDDLHGECWLALVWKYIKEEVQRTCLVEKEAKYPTEYDWEKGKEDLLRLLGEWALYPITYKKSKFVIPVKDSCHVLYVNRLDPDSYRQLPVPNPVYSLKLKNNWSVTIPESLKLAATLKDPTKVLDVLYYWREELSSMPFEKSKDKFSDLLDYFGKNCCEAKLSISKLKILRIYEDIHGCMMTLNGNFIVPSSDLRLVRSLYKLGSVTNTVILNPKSVAKMDLFKYLDSNYTKSDLAIFTNFVLPNLSLLLESEYIELLEYLGDKLYKTKLDNRKNWTPQEKDIVSTLEKTPFILFNGQLETANQFLDSYKPVFAAMKRKNLPKDWGKHEWRHFLRLSGLICILTADMFVEFAESLSRNDEDVQKKSKALVDYLFSHQEELTPRLCEIGSIEFLVPEEEDWLEKIFPSFKTSSGLISFSSSAQPQHKHLLWTTMSILPRYASFTVRPKLTDEAKKELQSHLNISEEVPKEKLFLHICNVTSISPVSDSVKDVMDSIYGHLNVESNHFLRRFAKENIPVIHLDEKGIFVTTDFVVQQLGNEIEPYLYRSPTRYGRFFSSFQKLGVSIQANCDHYIQVLNIIHEGCQEHKLNPEEERCMKLAIGSLAENMKQFAEITSTVFYLPTKEEKLKKSDEIYVSDNKELEILLEGNLDKPLFVGLAALKIEKNDVDFVRNLPISLRPKFLSEVVIEEFNPVEMIIVENCNNADIITSFISSKAFQTGILRLLNHCNLQANLPSLQDTEVESFEEKLKSVEVIPLKEIGVSLKLYGSDVGKRKKNYFVRDELDSDSRIIFYVKESARIKSVSQGLEEICAKLVPAVASNLHIVRMVQYLDDPSHLKKYLDENYIRDFGEVEEAREFYHNEIGTFLPKEFISLLDNEFCRFHKGEIVTMKKYLGTAVDSNEENLYIIVKVNRKVVSADNPMYDEYEVLTGDPDDPEIMVKSHQLYKFLRENPTKPQCLSATNSITDVVPNNDTYVSNAMQELSETESMTRIREEVKSIWGAEDDHVRRHLLRRLFLKWHPDKNVERKDLCTRMMQYIQSLVSRLENGEIIPDDDDYTASSREPSSDIYQNVFRSPPTFQSDTRRQGGGAQRRNFSSQSSTSENFKMSDRPEAEKWMKQAHHDHREASERKGASACWIVYMCYKAAEKALKAALYLDDCEEGARVHSGTRTHNLSSILGHLSLSDSMKSLVSSLERRVVSYNNMQYPTHSGPPCDRYASADAEFMVQETGILLENISQKF